MKSDLGSCELTKVTLGIQNCGFWGRTGCIHCIHSPFSMQDELVLPVAKALPHSHRYLDLAAVLWQIVPENLDHLSSWVPFYEVSR